MADTPNAPVYTTPQIFQAKARLFSWDMAGVSTGKPVKVADYPDKTFQVFDVDSSWGSATLVWEGSNDERADPDHDDYADSVWFTLTDTTETALSFTDDAGGQILQNPVWIRPKTTGGTNTDVKALLNVRK